MMQKLSKGFLALMVSSVLALGFVGCETHHDHPSGDHPKGEHSDHPKGDHDHPSSDKSDHPKSDHPE